MVDIRPGSENKNQAESGADATRRTSGASADQQPSTLQTGYIFANRYEIEAELGRGGMGSVYRARDMVLNRLVALKVLRAHLISDRTGMARFHKEAQTLSRLDHPGIIRVLEFASSPDGTPYMVMEFVDGELLASVIAREGGLPEWMFNDIAFQICDALKHAHEHNVLHRDLKPSNILLITTGDRRVVKLLDFGIAKLMDEGQRLTRSGEVFGSPLYMSPEQCEGHRMDVRSDIYSLGCCLYEMLAGTPPFVGKSLMQTINMHLNETPFDITLVRQDLKHGAALHEIIDKALAKSPGQRYSNIEELENDLKNVGRRLVTSNSTAAIQHSGIDASPKAKRDGKDYRAHFGMALGAVALIVSGIVCGVMLTRQQQSGQESTGNQLRSGERGSHSTVTGANSSNDALSVANRDAQNDSSIKSPIAASTTASTTQATVPGNRMQDSLRTSQPSNAGRLLNFKSTHVGVEWKSAFNRMQVSLDRGDYPDASICMNRMSQLTPSLQGLENEYARAWSWQLGAELNLCSDNPDRARDDLVRVLHTMRQTPREIKAMIARNDTEIREAIKLLKTGGMTADQKDEAAAQCKRILYSMNTEDSVDNDALRHLCAHISVLLPQFPNTEKEQIIALVLEGSFAENCEMPDEAKQCYDAALKKILPKLNERTDSMYIQSVGVLSEFYAMHGDKAQLKQLAGKLNFVDSFVPQSNKNEMAQVTAELGAAHYALACIQMGLRDQNFRFEKTEYHFMRAKEHWHILDPNYAAKCSLTNAKLLLMLNRRVEAAHRLGTILSIVERNTSRNDELLCDILRTLASCADDNPNWKGHKTSLLKRANAIKQRVAMLNSM